MRRKVSEASGRPDTGQERRGERGQEAPMGLHPRNQPPRRAQSYAAECFSEQLGVQEVTSSPSRMASNRPPQAVVPHAVPSHTLPPQARASPLSRTGSFTLRPVPPAFPPPDDHDLVLDKTLEEQENEIADELLVSLSPPPPPLPSPKERRSCLVLFSSDVSGPLLLLLPSCFSSLDHSCVRVRCWRCTVDRT